MLVGQTTKVKIMNEDKNMKEKGNQCLIAKIHS